MHVFTKTGIVKLTYRPTLKIADVEYRVYKDGELWRIHAHGKNGKSGICLLTPHGKKRHWRSKAAAIEFLEKFQRKVEGKEHQHRWSVLQGNWSPKTLTGETSVCLRCNCIQTTVRIPAAQAGGKLVKIYSLDNGKTWQTSAGEGGGNV